MMDRSEARAPQGVESGEDDDNDDDDDEEEIEADDDPEEDEGENEFVQHEYVGPYIFGKSDVVTITPQVPIFVRTKVAKACEYYSPSLCVQYHPAAPALLLPATKVTHSVRFSLCLLGVYHWLGPFPQTAAASNSWSKLAGRRPNKLTPSAVTQRGPCPCA